MAVDGILEDKGSVLRKRKRKKKCQRKKPDVNEKVEVRSVEEGSEGSWHQGTVITLDKRGYQVKYDYLLVDNSTDNVVDFVDVSPVINGIGCSCGNHCNYRACIRQLPPKLEFSKWNLFYGLCVDVWYMEAWWEGVIFDHEDGSEKRTVFFPDLGDEIAVEICNLRITQNCDDFDEEWHQRGTWLFLELIEEYEQEWYISVSVKQLWYDLREKKGFENEIEWTFSCDSLWKELVLEVIKDNHEIAVNHFLRVLGLPGSSQPECKSQLEPATPDADNNMNSDADLADTLALIPVENPMNSASLSANAASLQSIQENYNKCQLVHISKDKTNLLTECNGSCLDKAFCVLPDALLVSPSVGDGISCMSSITSSEGFSRSDANMEEMIAKCSRPDATAKWMTAGPDIVPKAESCPDAISKYILAGRHGNGLINDVRKHLLYQGWKIEYRRAKIFVRVRYISPTGDCYYSLYKLCLDLMNHSGELICSNTKDQHVEPNINDPHIVEPEYCPQAVLDWSNAEFDELRKCHSRKCYMAQKAKRHLSWLGWAFHYANSNGRRYLCYTSPQGRTYTKLWEACRTCIKEGGVSQDDASPRAVEKINVVEEADNQLASEKLSSVLPIMDIQRSSVPSNAESENFSRKSYSKLGRRNLVRQNRVGQRTRKPKRKRKDSSPGALIKLRENFQGGLHRSVLRSTKRVQQVVTPSPLHHGPLTVLSWLIDNNILSPRSEVHYWRKEQRLKVKGWVTRDGINCHCCDKVYTLGGFVEHAGSSNHRPAANIFLEDGKSLLDCQLQLIQNIKVKKFGRKRNSRLTHNWKIDKNDNICSVCHFGGELILCDQCPSSFHKSCLGLESVPDGDWFCPSCCCGICGQKKLEEDGVNTVDDRVLTCAQCEHKYHLGCICSRGEDRLEICAKENWFCSKKCEEIFLGLNELLGRPIPVGTDGLTWTLIKSVQSDTHGLDASYDEAMVENYCKLSIALDVMHECFDPVKEPRTGRDLVADILFCRSSELNRLNFQGFYTILLERHDELIAVANVRVHGQKVAEMPLIGTRFQHRRLGMCRILMNELEKKLMELGVERLILPAVPDVLHTWTASFGFSKMMLSERLQFVKYTFLDFQGATMCQKLLCKRTLVEPQPNLSNGSQFELHGDASESSDNVDVDGSSSVSEVFQAGEIEENGFMDQGLLERYKHRRISTSRS